MAAGAGKSDACPRAHQHNRLSVSPCAVRICAGGVDGIVECDSGHWRGSVHRAALREGRQQREVELADGHAGYRYSGYVTVTELDEQALENACGRLEQAAALAQLELRRLYGAQEEGYCCTLPTGRGCR